jgi:hypothetical protein
VRDDRGDLKHQPGGDQAIDDAPLFSKPARAESLPLSPSGPKKTSVGRVIISRPRRIKVSRAVKTEMPNATIEVVSVMASCILLHRLLARFSTVPFLPAISAHWNGFHLVDVGERDEADPWQPISILWNSECDDTFANDRIFRMSHVVCSAVAHVNPQRQEWAFL